MILFIILGIFAAANAERLVSVPMGFLDVVATVGEVPMRYDPLEPVDVVASMNATKWAVSMIPFISTGTPDIPPADPYLKDRVPPLDVQNSYASGKVYVKNLVARGMKNAVLNNLELRLKNNRADVTLNVPVIEADADYSAVLKAGFLPLTYDGHAKVVMEDVTARITTKSVLKKYKGVPVFQVDAIGLDIRARSLQLSLAEEVWNTVGDQVNVLFEDVIQQSMTILAKTIMSDVNQVLRLAPAQVVNQYLVGS